MSEVIHIGDVLVTPKDNYTNISHYSVYAGKSDNGTDWAIHNNIGTGVSWIPLNNLLQNGYERIDRFRGNVYERIERLEKAKSMIGKSYSLLKFNCEHFARLVKDGVSESNQVRNFAIGVAIVTALVLIIKTDK